MSYVPFARSRKNTVPPAVRRSAGDQLLEPDESDVTKDAHVQRLAAPPDLADDRDTATRHPDDIDLLAGPRAGYPEFVQRRPPPRPDPGRCRVTRPTDPASRDVLDRIQPVAADPTGVRDGHAWRDQTEIHEGLEIARQAARLDAGSQDEVSPGAVDRRRAPKGSRRKCGAPRAARLNTAPPVSQIATRARVHHWMEVSRSRQAPAAIRPGRLYRYSIALTASASWLPANNAPRLTSAMTWWNGPRRRCQSAANPRTGPMIRKPEAKVANHQASPRSDVTYVGDGSASQPLVTCAATVTMRQDGESGAVTVPARVASVSSVVGENIRATRPQPERFVA